MKVLLGPSRRKGLFQGQNRTNMEAGATYYYKAFVATANYTAYGEALKFVSKGSAAPTITYVSPSMGVPGDTVTITGLFFGLDYTKNTVKFSDTNAKVVGGSENTLQCLIPPLPPGSAHTIAVQNLNAPEGFYHNFTMLTPEFDYRVHVATFGDTITINGKNLPKLAEYAEVTVANTSYKAIEANGNFIKFILPDVLTQSIGTIFYWNLPVGIFQLKPPVIDDIIGHHISSYNPPPMVIRGKNFVIRSGGVLTSVEFVGPQNYWAAVGSSTKNEIVVNPRVLVPYPNFSSVGTYKVRVVISEVLGDFWDQNVTVNYLSRWTRQEEIPPADRSNGVLFSLNGKAYYGMGKIGSTIIRDLWEYDLPQDLWIIKDQVPFQQTADLTTTVAHESNAYLIRWTPPNRLNPNARNLNEVWEYNPQSDRWLQKTPFPGLDSSEGFGFSLNGKLYLGGLNSGGHYSFWEYNSGADTWEALDDIGHFNSPQIFIANNTAYAIAENKQNFYTYSLYKFDPATRQWILRYALPANYFSPQSFLMTIHQKVYLAFISFSSIEGSINSLYAFGPSNEGFNFVEGLQGLHLGKKAAFSSGNFGYSLQQEGIGKGLWKYDPSR